MKRTRTFVDRDPDEAIELAEGYAELYVGLAFVDGSIQADRIEIRESLDGEKSVLVFPDGGCRKIVSIRQTLQLHELTPGGPVSSKYGEQLDSTPMPEPDVRIILSIYDRFSKRTY